MRKVLYLFCITCITMIITACGSSSNDGTQDGDKSEFSTYKEALAANDFDAVYKILSQAETEIAKCNSSSDREDFAERFGFNANGYELNKVKLEVLKSELTFLVSQNNEELNDRIIFLINENNELLSEKGKHDEYCNHVATLAANQGNEELVKKIVEQFNDPFLILDNSAVSKFGKDKDFYVDMRYELLKQGVEVSRPQLGMVKSDSYGKLDKEYEQYNNAIKTYNRHCINAIEDALDAGDKDLANKINRLVKKNIKIEDLGDWCAVVEKDYESSSVYEAFKVTEDDSDIKEAKSLINNAK